MSFSFSNSKQEKYVLFELKGNLLDKESAEDLVNLFNDYLIDNDQYFIFSLAEMDYLNSTGLNVLIGLLTKVRNSGGELVVCNVPSKINQLLLITKLNTVFKVAQTVEEATEIVEEEIIANVSNEGHES